MWSSGCTFNTVATQYVLSEYLSHFLFSPVRTVSSSSAIYSEVFCRCTATEVHSCIPCTPAPHRAHLSHAPPSPHLAYFPGPSMKHSLLLLLHFLLKIRLGHTFLKLIFTSQFSSVSGNWYLGPSIPKGRIVLGLQLPFQRNLHPVIISF